MENIWVHVFEIWLNSNRKTNTFWTDCFVIVLLIMLWFIVVSNELVNVIFSVIFGSAWVWLSCVQQWACLRANFSSLIVFRCKVKSLGAALPTVSTAVLRLDQTRLFKHNVIYSGLWTQQHLFLIKQLWVWLYQWGRVRTGAACCCKVWQPASADTTQLSLCF